LDSIVVVEGNIFIAEATYNFVGGIPLGNPTCIYFLLNLSILFCCRYLLFNLRMKLTFHSYFL
jgi:hypothetical protein